MKLWSQAGRSLPGFSSEKAETGFKPVLSGSETVTLNTNWLRKSLPCALGLQGSGFQTLPTMSQMRNGADSGCFQKRSSPGLTGVTVLLPDFVTK